MAANTALRLASSIYPGGGLSLSSTARTHGRIKGNVQAGGHPTDIDQVDLCRWTTFTSEEFHMLAVSRGALGPSPAATGRSARSSPELEANLRTSRAQMADWVTCPSAKTPQGKAKIAQISAKLESIKQEIKKAKDPSPSGPAAKPVPERQPAVPAGEPADDFGASSRIGTRLDTYA